MKTKTQFKEEKRKKDNCIDCKRWMPIKAKKMCQNCWHKVKRRNNWNFFLRTRYTEIKQRCINPRGHNIKTYSGKNVCDRQDFLNKFIKDKNSIKLFKNWKKSNFDTKLVPSIDRIDNNGDYTIDNIQFITHSDNSRKDQKTTPVDVFDKDGNFLNSFNSLTEGAKFYDVWQANAWKVFHGVRKHTKGFVFKSKQNT